MLPNCSISIKASYDYISACSFYYYHDDCCLFLKLSE